MASTVTVFETAARRTVIKVSPAKYLHEVRAEACEKFRLTPDKYGLKHNSKTLDLSTPFRHTGLAPGARLELTLLSRSAGLVTVALQLPEAEATGVPNGRLIDKFPSTTTLWQILRRFEDGVAGTDAKRNLTARGVPLLSNGEAGAGRLYYEQPVLVVMHKELSSFVDLQKTLSTLGLNTGNVLIKLGFKASEQPFEEAQAQIGAYFQEIEAGERELEASRAESVPAEEATQATPKSNPTNEVSADPSTTFEPTSDSATAGLDTADSNPLPPQVGTEPTPIEGITDRPTTVFSAPSNAVPKAATIAHNEADFDYTVEHAQLQNAHYKSASKNKTLPSDAEIEAKKREATEKLAAVRSVKIRTRFPDNTQTLAEFNHQDTGQDLYSHVRRLIRHEDAPFTLRYMGKKGMANVPDDKKRLIQDVGLTGNATISLTWQEGASTDARKEPALKPVVAANAKEIEVPLPEAQITSEESKETKENVAPKSDKKGMPAWLKKTLPGAKR